ncbi:hypothetical protein PG991_010407 [Apiospora marii]|uniref:Uncharacterized protein n=1 Tax=Apiospora marii TaxID=335849 RepID=A0ABR1RIC2_9PEZI
MVVVRTGAPLAQARTFGRPKTVWPHSPDYPNYITDLDPCAKIHQPGRLTRLPSILQRFSPGQRIRG